MNRNISKYSWYVITCTNCGHTEEINTADGEWRYDDTPTKYFRRQGWGITRESTHCKNC